MTFAAAFALLAGWVFWTNLPAAWAGLSLGVAAGFVAAAILAPARLRPLNVWWHRLGLLLHRIVNPLLLGALYFGLFTPMGLAMRLVGRDSLRLKVRPGANGYWLFRNDESDHGSSMRNQF
jgi:hypothetical protein